MSRAPLVSIGSSCNKGTAFALDLGDTTTLSKPCGYFEYLEIMKSQQAQKAAKSCQDHVASLWRTLFRPARSTADGFDAKHRPEKAGRAVQGHRETQ